MNSQILTCQYRKKGCQRLASYHFFIKLNFYKLDKGYTCSNCKEIIQKPQIFLSLNNPNNG